MGIDIIKLKVGIYRPNYPADKNLNRVADFLTVDHVLQVELKRLIIVSRENSAL